LLVFTYHVRTISRKAFHVVVTEQAIPTRADLNPADTWDLSDLFASDDEFFAELDLIDGRVDSVSSFQGRLGESAETLLAALVAASDLQLGMERTGVYARLRYDENTADTDGQARIDRATAIAIRAGQALAWFDPELLEVPEETLARYMAKPALEPWRHVVDDIVRNRAFTKSAEIEALLVAVGDISRTARDAFSSLDNADISYGTVHDDDGNPVELTKGRFHILEESRNREVRREAYETLTDAYLNHKHVLASLHAGTVRKDVFYAKARGFRSARHAALNANNIDEQVYDNLIDVTRQHLGTVARYLELRRRLLGVDQLELWDSWVPLSELPSVRYAWEEAVDIVCEGLAPLGSAYVDQLRTGLTSGRWTDVHETKGKRSGAYSWGAYGAHPVILMNWNGTLSDVFTLAHEAGHAMHTWLANASQPYQTAHYPIFLAEIASTLNEVLLTWHLLGNIPETDRMARFAILNRFADQIMGTHVRQTMFAEFERETHRTVEADEPLVLQALNDLYANLYTTYTPGMHVDERASVGWSRVPHFYNGFYVYQYATGISAGIALAKSVRDEGGPAVKRVLGLYADGGCDYPLQLLAKAGVDLLKPDAIDACMVVFGETVTELEALVNSGLFSELNS
jgi:oligoendopeptidase F